MVQDGTLIIRVDPDLTQFDAKMSALGAKQGRLFQKAFDQTQPLGRITGQVDDFARSLSAANARVIAFGLSTGLLFKAKQAFVELGKSMVEVESSMADINAVYGGSKRQMEQLSNSLFTLANRYSVTFGTAASSMAEFARQGLSVEDSLERVGAAMALSRLAGMGAEQSVSALTSILNTFTKEGLKATEVVNRLVAVDQAFAVSSGDLAEALSRVSSSAADANVSLNETMALITAAKQITARSSSVIGNSFKTMFTRLARPEVISDLESVGIKARDTNGKLMPMMDILRNLALSYDNLNSSQRSFVSETVGGVYQINILKAILRDLGGGLSIVDRAMSVAGSGTDSLTSRLETLNETLSSRLVRAATQTKQAFANIGAAGVMGPAKSGVEVFGNAARMVADMTDPTAEGVGAHIARGIIKGIGKTLTGPGLYVATAGLIKLSTQLMAFIGGSAKHLLGIGQAERTRLELTQSISRWLQSEPAIYQAILQNQMSLNNAATTYLNILRQSALASKQLGIVSASIGTAVAPNVISKQTVYSAAGFIPDIEKVIASSLGYDSGRSFTTNVFDGTRTRSVVMNTAETISRVRLNNGKVVDFINPPADSYAGRMHRERSIRTTGVDPYKKVARKPLSAEGFIPSMGFHPSSDPSGSFTSMMMPNAMILAALGMSMQGIGGTSKLDTAKTTGFLKSFTSEGEKAVISLRKLEESVAGARVLISQGKPVSFGGQTYQPSDVASFDKAVAAAENRLRPIAIPYQEQMREQRARHMRGGMTLAIGGSMLGSLASNTDFGAGLNEFSSSLSTAGMFLMALPNKLGRITAIGTAVSGLISAISVGTSKHVANQKALQDSLERNQKMVGAMEKTLLALNRYTEVINASTSSMRDIQRAQREASEATAALMGTKEGDALVNRLRTAPSEEARMQILAEEQRRLSNETAIEQGVAKLKEYRDRRSFLGSSLIGIKPFGARDDEQAKFLKDMFSGIASTVVQNLSAGDKAKLMGDSGGERAKRLAEQSFPTLGKEGQTLMANALVNVLNRERALTDPRRAGAERQLQQANEQRQSMVDSANNAYIAAQRLYYNTGALMARNILGGQEVNRMYATGRSMQDVDISKSLSRLVSKVAGPRTVAQYDYANEVRAIDLQRRSDVANEQATLVGVLVDKLSEGIGGGQLSTSPGATAAGVSEYQGRFLEALNKGISGMVQSGGMASLLGKGPASLDELGRGIAAYGTTDRALQTHIQSFVSAHMDKDMLKAIASSNLNIAKLNLQAAEQRNKAFTELQAIKANIVQGNMSKFAGGLDILDRDKRRALERNLSRGAFLMERGRTAEARAEGAASFLSAMKSMGISPDEAMRGPLGAALNAAMNIGTAGLASVQSQMLARVAGSMGRLGLGSTASMAQLMGTNTFATARAAMLQEYKPESILPFGSINQINSQFNSELGRSVDVIEEFTSALSGLKERMMSSGATARSMGEWHRVETEAAQRRFGEQYPLPQETGQSFERDSWLQRQVSGPLGKAALPLLTTAGVWALGKYGRNIRVPFRRSGAPVQRYSAQPHWATGLSMEEAARMAGLAERAGMSVDKFGRRYGSRIGASPEFTDIVAEPVTQPAATTQLSYKARQALKKRERLERRAAERASRTEYLQRHFADEVQVVAPKTLEDTLTRPRTAEEQRIWERNIERAKLSTSAGRKSLGKLERYFGRIRLSGPAKMALVAGGLSALSQEVFGGEGGEALGGYGSELSGFGLETLGNAAMFGGFKGMMSKGALAKGGALAASGLISNEVANYLGGTKGQLAGMGIDLGSAAAFFGKSGLAGAGIGIASELVRQNLTAKYLGYTAGAGQGIMGAAGAGAMFGGPVGSVIGAGLYMGGEAMQVRGESKDAIALSRALDAYNSGQRATQVGRLNDIYKEASVQLASLSNRENALLGMKESDARYGSGWSGRVASTLGLTQRQFGSVEAAELNKITTEKARLGEALSSGDKKEIASALASLKEALGQIYKVQTGQADVSSLKEGKTLKGVESNFTVNVNLDRDNIDDAIKEKFVIPLLRQIEILHGRIDQIANGAAPIPARI